MVVVQGLLAPLDREAVGDGGLPGEGEQELDVVARDIVFRVEQGGLFELGELLVDDFLDVVGELGALDARFELGDLVVGGGLREGLLGDGGEGGWLKDLFFDLIFEFFGGGKFFDFALEMLSELSDAGFVRVVLKEEKLGVEGELGLVGEGVEELVDVSLVVEVEGLAAEGEVF